MTPASVQHLLWSCSPHSLTLHPCFPPSVLEMSNNKTMCVTNKDQILMLMMEGWVDFTHLYLDLQLV
jgi:hypothetical protein